MLCTPNNTKDLEIMFELVDGDKVNEKKSIHSELLNIYDLVIMP